MPAPCAFPGTAIARLNRQSSVPRFTWSSLPRVPPRAVLRRLFTLRAERANDRAIRGKRLRRYELEDRDLRRSRGGRGCDRGAVSDHADTASRRNPTEDGVSRARVLR